MRNQKSEKFQDLNIGVLMDSGEIKMIDCVSKKNELWGISNTAPELKLPGSLVSIVSDWRDISSHYIMTKDSSNKMQITGFQHGKFTPLNQMIEYQNDEEIIRCITPNEEEDFVLLSRKGKTIRTFINTDIKSQHMTVRRERTIPIANPELIGPELHTVVGTHNNDYLLLFNKKDIFKLSLLDGTVTCEKDFNI